MATMTSVHLILLATSVAFVKAVPKAWPPRQYSLYVGSNNDVLYTVDTTKGVATRVGSATQFGVSETFPRGMAAIGSTLYMVGDGNDVLYTVDTTTGVATRVGSATQLALVKDYPAAWPPKQYSLYDGEGNCYSLPLWIPPQGWPQG